MNPLQRGALIVIEGVDRSGKSTQCRRLVKNLLSRNIKAELLGFPDRTKHTGMDMNWCMQPENGLPKPDLVFLFKLNQKEAAERNGFGDERYENQATQLKVSQTFSHFAEVEDNWKVIDASKTKDEIETQLLELVLRRISEVADTELTNLQFSVY
ncbi:hypothetical protein ABEB36_014124 [Hypothenemus hampei]|uniref:Thymidylate kinase-like domain-containing protein n=1 Tax=Hypothenemus hampei TaxID=57062 RepID=A0ABD1E7Z2_HYPHA